MEDGFDPCLMKDWVIPFLMEEWEKAREEKNPYLKPNLQEKELKKRELRESSLTNKTAVYRELIGYLNFCVGGSDNAAFFTDVFGSVLTNLPKDCFIKLRKMKSLFFFLPSGVGAEVKQIELKDDIKAGEILQAAIFPIEVVSRPTEVMRGVVAHELAHICLGHLADKPPYFEVRENQADDLAKDWGFKKEIEAMREYHKEKRWGI